jgi:hypothetical protein
MAERTRTSTSHCDIQPCPHPVTGAMMVEAVTVGTSQLVPTNRALSSLTSGFCPQPPEPHRLIAILALIVRFQPIGGEGGIPDSGNRGGRPRHSPETLFFGRNPPHEGSSDQPRSGERMQPTARAVGPELGPKGRKRRCATPKPEARKPKPLQYSGASPGGRVFHLRCTHNHCSGYFRT